KAVMERGGKEVAEAVAAGRADIGVTFISEILPINGVKLAGPLPSDLQAYVVYATAIPKASADPAAARAFIDALISPAMAGRWTRGGVETQKREFFAGGPQKIIPAANSCILPRARLRCRWRRILPRRRLIRHDRCASSSAFRPAARPISPRAWSPNGCRSD